MLLMTLAQQKGQKKWFEIKKGPFNLLRFECRLNSILIHHGIAELFELKVKSFFQLAF